jgi:integrase
MMAIIQHATNPKLRMVLLPPSPACEPLPYLSNQVLIEDCLIAAVKAAKLFTPDGKPKHTGFHCLRHFNTSWLINSREDGGCGLAPKAVQERLGHANITMTLNVYGHLFPRGDDAGALDKAFSALLG